MRHALFPPPSVSARPSGAAQEVTIVDSVRSLMDLDYRLYEIIVIDDGSKDETAGRLI